MTWPIIANPPALWPSGWSVQIGYEGTAINFGFPAQTLAGMQMTITDVQELTDIICNKLVSLGFTGVSAQIATAQISGTAFNQYN